MCFHNLSELMKNAVRVFDLFFALQISFLRRYQLFGMATL